MTFVCNLHQVASSTIVKMLDNIIDSSSQVPASVNGKKKKLDENQKSDLPTAGVCRGENALSFLSSLLDVLLLKKDIANRFS